MSKYNAPLNPPMLIYNKCRYVKNILKKTSRSIDQVTIQPDGKWDMNSRKEVLSDSRLNGMASESDDDIVEITKSGTSVKMSGPRSYGTPAGQLSQPRDQLPSAPSRDSSSASSKRPRAAVIDLTSSGDEDDQPLARPPAPKRQQTSFGNPSSVPAYRPPPPRA
jgi:E3 SUMO-protein ligase PIAS1